MTHFGSSEDRELAQRHAQKRDASNDAPAYPNPALADENCHFSSDVTGLTKREWFAGMALSNAQIPWAASNEMIKHTAEKAFRIADAMIEAGK